MSDLSSLNEHEKNTIRLMGDLSQQWEALRSSLMDTPKYEWRLSLLTRDSLTEAEAKELEQLNEWAEKLPCGSIESQGRTKRLESAVACLERAAKAQKE